MYAKKGFTLIELLVVISIIALLISIMMPALNMAKKIARRAACASNLHQWGLAIQEYSQENSDKLMGSTKAFNNEGRYPSLSWVYRQGSDFSAEVIGPYLPGFDFKKKTFGDVWNCPANNLSVETMVQDQWNSYGAFHMEYSYYARVDLWPNGVATFPQTVTADNLVSMRLLMADTCYRWWVNGAWMYNHGLHGPSCHIAEWTTGHIDYGPPAITGLNQLYGDGHVEWKNQTQFDPELMDNCDVSQPQVKGAGGGARDTSFYAR